GGPFTFYYVVNFVNNDNTTSGDNAIIGVSNVVMPVVYSNIEVYEKEGYVYLHWVTESENLNAVFEIQKLNIYGVFETIGTVRAKRSNQNNTYTFVDEKPSIGTSYYRIKQIDIDGKYTYSGVYSIDFQYSYTKLDFWYNNYNEQLHFKYDATHQMQGEIYIYDTNGREIVYFNRLNNIKLDALARGLYFVKVRVDDKVLTQTIFIND
ncbi:MAG TPA: T9SS type A sorting domain-containing protein, partial [Saprospiraceae bacterium]|nr:T9SS type A sorting domain-containing protein [Saprospiraceae bacterium]